MDSKVGEWSSFAVDFPLHEAPVDLSDLKMSHPELLPEGLNMLLISPPPNRHKCSNVGEELRRQLEAYGVNVFPLASMEKMEEILSERENNRARGGKYACFVHEDLYNENLYLPFSERRKSVLLTYGPNFSVRHSREHFSCPLQVLPSVLIKRIMKHVVSIDDVAMRASDRPSTSKETSRPGKDGVCADVADDTISIPPNPFHNFRILVAEDNKINQKVIGNMLKRIGVGYFEVANNGQEAVEKEYATKFDLVLMDMQVRKYFFGLLCLFLSSILTFYVDFLF